MGPRGGVPRGPLAQTLMSVRPREFADSAGGSRAGRARARGRVEGHGRHALLEPLKDAVRSWSAVSGRSRSTPCRSASTSSAQRAELLRVFAPWRRELWEQQLASPEDTVARFQRGGTWIRRVRASGGSLMQDAPVDDLQRRVQSCSRRPHVVALQPRTASWPCSTRQRVGQCVPAGADELARRGEALPEVIPLERRVRTTPPEADRGRRRDFLEELARRGPADARAPRSAARGIGPAVAGGSGGRSRSGAGTWSARPGRPSRQRNGAHVRALRDRALSDAAEPAHRHEVPRPEPIFPGKALPTLLDSLRLLETMGLGDP